MHNKIGIEFLKFIPTHVLSFCNDEMFYVCKVKQNVRPSLNSFFER